MALAWDVNALNVLLRVGAEAAGTGMPLGRVQPGQVSTDTRTLAPGDLFVALDGASYAGADFLPAARARGAWAAVVHEGARAAAVAAGLAYWAVPSCLDALAALAADARLAHSGPVLAVTGSNGKTTTKELLAAALAPLGAVHRTQGNLNNAIGVPKTLFAWPDGAVAAVVEMGMNAPGEIAHLARMARPDVGLVTSVAAAHLQGLGTLANVARAKCELYAELGPDAVRVVNADDTALMQAAAPYLTRGPTLRFGWQDGADVQVLACHSSAGEGTDAAAASAGMALRLRVHGQTYEGHLPVVGRHNATNAAAALAAATAVGVAPGAALAAMARAVPPSGRLAIHHLRAPAVHLVDDGYNANPASMRAALQTVRELAGAARMVAVLGEMRELGPAARAMHAEVGAAAAERGATLFAVGPLGDAMAEGARAAGGTAHSFADVPDCLHRLVPTLAPGDWVLVKGSRGMRMERVVAALTGPSSPPAHP